MGLFSRRSQAAVIDLSWQPESEDIIVAPSYLMDDDGCEGDRAFGARFVLESAPEAALTIWAYPVFASADPNDGFIVGYRVEYGRDHGGGYQQWSAALYYAHPEGSDYEMLFGTFEEAEEHARGAAASFISDGLADTQGLPAEYLDWDGAMW